MYLLYAVTAKSSYRKKENKSFLMLCKRWILGLWNSLYPLAVTWHSACQYLWFIRVFLFALGHVQHQTNALCQCLWHGMFLFPPDRWLTTSMLPSALRVSKNTPVTQKTSCCSQINWHNNFIRTVTVVQIVHLNISGSNSC